MSEPEWTVLQSVWTRELGEFDEVTGYSRLQPERAGGALLLLRRGRAVAFVKLRRGEPGALVNESAAMRAVWSYGPQSFLMPEPLGTGGAEGWHYLACAPLPAGRHRPPHEPQLGPILAEIEGALSALPRPPGVPAHWRPMHGDFAPWNLRQLRDGRLALIDWEDAGWGPPGADALFYEATSLALWGGHPAPTTAAEAVEFWKRRIEPRPGTGRDLRLATGLTQALSQLGAPATGST
jgi:hypothetical protein